MRISTTLIKMICVPLALAALVACSGKTSTDPIMVDPSGKHPANWLQQHWIVYEQLNGGSKAVSSTTTCSECHGADLSGGISKVSCFGAEFSGLSCHANADHTLGHPAGWGSDPSSSVFHAFATFNGDPVRGNANLGSSSSCGLCHATDTNTTLLGSVPSCLANDPNLGIACHGTSPAAKSTGCVSCHGAPPDGQAPVGDKAPNQAGAHAVHLSLAGVTCGTCHFSYGTGSRQHATGNGSAFLNLSSPYRAKSGAFSFSGGVNGSCSGVSCHGGKQTPAWTGGILSAGCLSCHEQGTVAQSPQYNSFYSGNVNGVNLHQVHLATTSPVSQQLIACTDCHNVATLAAKHFSGLGTPQFEGAPGASIGSGTTQITNYDQVTTSCTNNCHANYTIPGSNPPITLPNPAHWTL